MADEILLTGATGFVGGGVMDRLREEGSKVRAVTRGVARVVGASRIVPVSDIADTMDWRDALDSCDVVIHTAARVHVLRDDASDPTEAYRRVNVDGTLRLARQAAEVGVTRFVFISTVKVNGERTVPGHPFDLNSATTPRGSYAVSKRDAEVGLQEIAAETGLEVVIIRPTLVYGPGVRANFRSLMLAISRGVPLPFGSLQNLRSFVGIENLVDLIAICLTHSEAANRVFLVSDGEDVSTPELVRRLGEALGRPARLIPIPERVLEMGATIAGRRDVARRLLDSLQVDMRQTRELLQWSPPRSLDDGLAATAAHFLGRGRP